MSERFSGAIEELETELQEQLQDVSSTKKLKPPRYTDTSVETVGPIRKDVYYGKPLATAVQMVLERMQGASTAADILKALENGGFDFRPMKWDDTKRLRNLAISMAKNTKAFHRLPNGTYGLVSWYDAATINASKQERARGVDEKDDPIAAEEAEGETSV